MSAEGVEELLRKAMRLVMLKPTGPARLAGVRSLAALPPALLHNWNQPEEVSPVNGWTLLFGVMTERAVDETSFREGGQVDAVQALLDAGIAVTMALPALLAQPAFRSTNEHHERLFRFLLERTAQESDLRVLSLLRQCASPVRCPDEIWRKAIQRTCDRPSPQLAGLIAAARPKLEARKRKMQAAAMEQEQEEEDEEDHGKADDGTSPTKKSKTSSSSSPHEEEDSDTSAIRAKLLGYIVPSPNVRWEDIDGLEAAKLLLKQAALLPIAHPQLFNEKEQPWKGILLYGPPGTGQSPWPLRTAARQVSLSDSCCPFVVHSYRQDLAREGRGYCCQ